MAKYPIKMLKDEDNVPFVPLVGTDAIVDPSGTTLQEKLNAKLEKDNIIAGENVTITEKDGNLTISTSGKGALIDNLDTDESGLGGLDAHQGKILKEMIPTIANNLTTIDATQTLSAYQGYILNNRVVPKGGDEGQVLKKSANGDWQLEWGDAADPNAIIGDGTIKKIVYLTWDEYKALETIDEYTEYHITDMSENSTLLNREDIQDMIDTSTSKYYPLTGGILQGDMTIAKNAGIPYLTLKDTVNSYDVTPTTTVYPAVIWADKNNKAMGRVELIESTNGSRCMSMYAIKPNDTTGGAFFKVGWNTAGEAFSSVDGNLTVNKGLTVTNNVSIGGSITVGSGFGKKYSFTKTLRLGTAWIDTGISSNDLPQGAYIVYMTGIYDTDKSWQDGNIYVGLMTMYTGQCNGGERFEIPLHRGGHAFNGYDISLATLNHSNSSGMRITLQIKSSVAFTRDTAVKFTFVKII